jgi:hypothetical protein
MNLDQHLYSQISNRFKSAFRCYKFSNVSVFESNGFGLHFLEFVMLLLFCYNEFPFFCLFAENFGDNIFSSVLKLIPVHAAEDLTTWNKWSAVKFLIEHTMIRGEYRL